MQRNRNHEPRRPVTPDSTAVQRLITSLSQRIARAASHGQELGDRIQGWTRDNPVVGRVVIADDRLSWELQVELADPPFDDWASVFGDGIHNLRSALDHLVWGLATLDGSEPQRPTRLQFPIARHVADWEGSSGRQAERTRIASLPSAAQIAIEQVQPFQRSGIDGTPESDGLLLLHRLSNTDKHRFALRPEINLAELSHSFSIDFGSDEAASQNVPPDVTISGDVFTPGTPVVRQVTKTPIVDLKCEFGIKAQVVVIDPVVGAVGVTTVLAQLATYVPQVMDHVLSAMIPVGDATSANQVRTTNT